MTKRLQIPVSELECSYFQAAARRAGMPRAEWARRQLRVIKSLNAPVAPVETMIEESIAGRYS